MTSASGHASVTAQQIADLLAWARSLAEQGATADPAERAAFLAAKHERIHKRTMKAGIGRLTGSYSSSFDPTCQLPVPRTRTSIGLYMVRFGNIFQKCQPNAESVCPPA